MKVYEFLNDIENTNYHDHYSYHQLAFALHLGLDLTTEEVGMDKEEILKGRLGGWLFFHSEGSTRPPQDGDVLEAKNHEFKEDIDQSVWFEYQGKLYEVVNSNNEESHYHRDGWREVDLAVVHLIDPNWNSLKFYIREVDYSDYDLDDERGELMFRIGECACDGFIDQVARLQLNAVHTAIEARDNPFATVLEKIIYDNLPNPSDIEEMVGELEHWVNPTQGTIFFADKMTREELESEFQALGEQANNASAMLDKHLDMFFNIMEATNSNS